jgi:hypothetical protein
MGGLLVSIAGRLFVCLFLSSDAFLSVPIYNMACILKKNAPLLTPLLLTILKNDDRNPSKTDLDQSGCWHRLVGTSSMARLVLTI